MADFVYNVSKNNVDISDLRILLLVGYTPSPDHATIDAVIAAATKEADFTNYARKALTGEEWEVDDADNVGRLLADNPPTWEDAGGATNNTFSVAVVYEHHGADDGDNIPVACYDVEETTDGGDLVLSFTDDSKVIETA